MGRIVHRTVRESRDLHRRAHALLDRGLFQVHRRQATQPGGSGSSGFPRHRAATRWARGRAEPADRERPRQPEERSISGGIDADGVRPYPGSSDVLEWLAAQSIPRAVVSSSRNAEAVLGAAGLRDLIDVVIDGNEASVLGLPGKPAPDTYLRAAEVLCAVPERTIVVEDAVSGVAAGRAGGFWVVGIDRGAGGNNLFENGADTVIADLAEMFGLETPSKPL
ncbi:HAD family hydrolase [Mycolicibacterium mageritense]|uniref:HAD family hydrolase n=1 Tax=Mycolicibacterium mageritense TaxID=53462 RepID=UPI001E5BBB52|nr:HAD family phosphatase [Mycolicibacterium mageritense]MCC9185115.1 HAD family phosphatase [Mycolicibacterium mageritense]